MTAHAPRPGNRAGIDSAFVAQVLGKREAARLADLMADAERRARDKLDAAVREAEMIFAEARAEAEVILAMLPDFAAIEAVPAAKGKSAYRAIRAVADKHSLPMAAVVGRQRDVRALRARAEAVAAVAEACPKLSNQQIGALFSKLPETSVIRMKAEGKR